MKECPICKSNNVITLTDKDHAYGLVKITAPDNADFNTLLLVNVYMCKDCGNVQLQHVDPKAVKK